MNRTFFSLAVLVLSSSFGWAGALPGHSWKGTTALVNGDDVMALLLKKDPKDDKVAYAILAEYDRTNGAHSPERLSITKWVNRMYVYRVEETGRLQYALKPLRVSGGDIVVDAAAGVDSLTLAKEGTLKGAVLVRREPKTGAAVETVQFHARAISTWEPYVAGSFFGTKDSTGGDYFKKGVNMTLSKDGIAEYSMTDVKGRFQVAEKLPGMFTFTAASPSNLGSDRIVSRIGVFVDIVNWKPVFTTDELLLINPDDAKDVGFYYERH